MDVSEFIHQVNDLLSYLRDPANNFLGREYVLNANTSNIIQSLMYQPSSDPWKPQVYTTKLIAKPSPNTGARVTVPLLDKLVLLKMEGPGERTSHMGVEWWFVVEDGEPSSPTYSSSDEDENENELMEDVEEDEEDAG
ncbi:hypothetical protein N431DRAFT_474197 [Stipitochalara longipes BDJ]|nr:hypothetical protein N431DRAFT_474197 [Stipitochalara longipes BDJ]